jgi:hypothetical protein
MGKVQKENRFYRILKRVYMLQFWFRAGKIYVMTYMLFCAYLERNSQNIFRGEECLDQLKFTSFGCYYRSTCHNYNLLRVSAG